MDSLKGRDLLTLGDFTSEEVRLVLDTAIEQKAAWARGDRSAPLAGKAVALIFMKPSMRTRVSFEVACARLGATPIVLGVDSAFSRSESVHDTVKTMERYVDAIVLRTYAQAHVEQVAEFASVPVVNSLTDDYHPCQVLADLLTIEEQKGCLSGMKAVFVGDGNNMANTWLLGAALTGMSLTVACPAGYEPLHAALDRAREIALSTGSRLEVVHDPMQAMLGADVVITDTWASMGQEDEHAERVKAFAPYQVNAGMFDLAAEEAVFLHCLPAHRGEEVTDEIIDSPNSVVFDEAENRLHVQKALLSLLV